MDIVYNNTFLVYIVVPIISHPAVLFSLQRPSESESLMAPASKSQRNRHVLTGVEDVVCLALVITYWFEGGDRGQQDFLKILDLMNGPT